MTRQLSLRKTVLFIFSLMVLLMGATVHAAEISLAWDANTETDLDGYKLYYGTISQNYSDSVDVGQKTKHTVKNLEEGQTYFFALIAYDTEGNESSFSNEIRYQVPLKHHVSPNPMVWLDVLLSDESETFN